MQKVRYLAIILVAIFTSLVSHAQINKQYIYYLGESLIVEDKNEDALDVLNMLLRADSTDCHGYFLRGVVKYNLGDLMGAEGDFTKAIEYNPVFTLAFQYRAITNSFLGKYNSAIEDFATAVDIRPDKHGIRYSRGVTYFLSQQFEEAIKDFDHYLVYEPDAVDAYINRGSSYLFMGDTTHALYNYDKAVKVNKNDAAAYLRRGSLYLQVGSLDSAYNDLSRSILLDSTDIAAYFGRAITSAYSNRPVEAIKDFDSAIKIDTTNSLAYFNRALLKSQIGDNNNALEDYNKVAYYSPSNVLVYFNRGLLNEKLGNINDAEKDYSKAIELYPDFANAYLCRAYLRHNIGNMSGSKSDHNIAQLKIAEYKEKLNDSTFSIYADTSRMFSKLLSFDPDFGNEDFNNIHSSEVDIKLLPMYRLTAAHKTSTQPEVYQYQNSDIKNVENKYQHYDIKVATPMYQLETEQVKDIGLAATLDIKERKSRLVIDAAVNHAIRQYTSAIELYNEAIKNEPKNAILYMSRAVAHTEMIEFISSLSGSNQKLVIDADPASQLKSPETTYNYDDALSDIEYAIDLNNKIAYLYYNKANILYLCGDRIGAIENYTKAIELYPYMAEAHYNRGLIHISLKEYDKGFLDLSKAGELGLHQAYEVANRYSNLMKQK